MTTNQRRFEAAVKKASGVYKESDYEVSQLRRQGRRVVRLPHNMGRLMSGVVSYEEDVRARKTLVDKQMKELESLGDEVAEVKERLGEQKPQGVVGKLLEACQKDADLEAEVYARFEGGQLPKKMREWQERIVRMEKWVSQAASSSAKEQEWDREKQEFERMVGELQQENDELRNSEVEVSVNLGITTAQIATVEHERDTAISEIRELQGKVSEQAAEIQGLTMEKTAMSMKLDGVEREKLQLESSVRRLREKEESWKVEKSKLQSIKHDQDMANVDLLLEKVTLDAEKRRLDEQIAELDREVDWWRWNAGMAESCSRNNGGLIRRLQRECEQEKARARLLEEENRRLQQECDEELTRLREDLEEMELFRAQETVRFQAFLDDTNLERSTARLKLLEKRRSAERRAEHLQAQLEESNGHLKRSREEKVEVERSLKRMKIDRDEARESSIMHCVDAIEVLNRKGELEEQLSELNAGLKAAQSEVKRLEVDLAAEQGRALNAHQTSEVEKCNLRELLQEEHDKVANLEKVKEDLELVVQGLRHSLKVEQERVEEQIREHAAALSEMQSKKAHLSENLEESETRRLHLSSVLNAISPGLQDLNVEKFAELECKAQEWLDRIPGMARRSACCMDDVVLRMVRGESPTLEDLTMLVSGMVSCTSFVLAVVYAFVDRRIGEGCKGGLVLVRLVELLHLHGQDVSAWLVVIGKAETDLENALLASLRGEEFAVANELSICEKALVVRTDDGLCFCWADQVCLLISDGDWYVEVGSGIMVKLSIDMLDALERLFPEMVKQALS